MSILDNSAIERIAARDLEADALALLGEFGGNDDVVFFLGRFAWQGQMTACIAPLLTIAKDPARGRYARIAAARAVMSVGDAAQHDALWSAIHDSTGPLDRRVIAELVDMAAPTSQNVERLLQIFGKLEPYERFQVTGLKQVMHRFIDRLPIMADGADEQPIPRLVEGLNAYLEREPHLERGECRVSEEFAWLMAPALHAVDRLVAARAGQALDAPALAILFKMPALRFWHGSDVGEHRTALADNVPRWIELNDRLYWANIAEARPGLEAKGQPLVNDWQIAYLGHFWRFGAADFDRCLGWIRTRDLPDDRLVAMSRCVALFFEYERPVAWRESLIETCAGDPVLATALAERLDPEPSPALVKIEAEHRDWQRDRDERDAEDERQRAEWIETLKADPERVRRPGLDPGEFSRDQYLLMQSVPSQTTSQDHAYGADWRGLINEFGSEVAEAYRDAAVAHWRAFRPGLRSEGADTSSTPYSLIFAMAGLLIAAQDDPRFFSDMSPQDAAHAARYVTWELNGFPSWFEALYRAHEIVTKEAVATELIWELDHTLADAPMHYVLHDILYYTPWLHAAMAPVLLEWLRSNDAANEETVRYALAVIAGGDTAQSDIAELASRKLIDPDVPGRARWLAYWVDSEPDRAIPMLQAELEGLDGDAARQLAEAFVVALLGDRNGSGTLSGAYRTVAHLKTLYVLMHHHIQVAEDIERANMGVYSPNLRDHAQEARNRLFVILADIPGPEAYAAIKALEIEHPVSDYRSWMAQRARARAIADADELAWTAADVRRFELGFS